MISFLGCDRISRTAGGRPAIFAARSSCSSATTYGFGFLRALGHRVHHIIGKLVMSGSRLTGGGARALALEIAAEARAEWGYASEIIARAFARIASSPAGIVGSVSETVYGLIRMDRRLDAILEELAAARRARRRRSPATSSSCWFTRRGTAFRPRRSPPTSGGSVREPVDLRARSATRRGPRQADRPRSRGDAPLLPDLDDRDVRRATSVTTRRWRSPRR